MKKPPKVYIAGPYRAATHKLVDANIDRARIAGLEAIELGWNPLTPHLLFAGMDRLADDIKDEKWLALTMDWLRECDAVYLVRGYESSAGTLAEIAEAERLGIPVYKPGKLSYAPSFLIARCFSAFCRWGAAIKAAEGPRPAEIPAGAAYESLADDLVSLMAKEPGKVEALPKDGPTTSESDLAGDFAKAKIAEAFNRARAAAKNFQAKQKQRECKEAPTGSNLPKEGIAATAETDEALLASAIERSAQSLSLYGEGDHRGQLLLLRHLRDLQQVELARLSAVLCVESPVMTESPEPRLKARRPPSPPLRCGRNGMYK